MKLDHRDNMQQTHAICRSKGLCQATHKTVMRQDCHAPYLHSQTLGLKKMYKNIKVHKQN